MRSFRVVWSSGSARPGSRPFIRSIFRCNRTSDTEINALSIREQYVVVTKDADFVNSFHLRHQPYKLLLVSTGNISNADLEALLSTNIESISQGFDVFDFIEIDRNTVIFHS